MDLIIRYICNNFHEKVLYSVTYNCTRQQAVISTIGGNKADSNDDINEKINILFFIVYIVKKHIKKSTMFLHFVNHTLMICMGLFFF